MFEGLIIMGAVSLFKGSVVIALVLAVFAISLAVKGVIIVKQSECVVVERLGKFNRVLNSGINVIIPVYEQTRSILWRFSVQDYDGTTIVKSKMVVRIDLRETVYDFPRQNVITKDNVGIEINGLLYFQITDPVKSVYEIANLPNAIEKLAQTSLRNIIGELDLDETLSSRDTINNRLRVVLDDATDKWGVKVNRVELQDINPPVDVKNAMEKQMRAERDRRANILEAEGMKQARILDAEGIRQSEINKAEGEKQARILKAEGEAEARVRVAEAEAETIRRVTEAVKAANADPVQYMVAIRYIDTLKEMVSGKDNKIVYLPVEASGVLGSIGGIKDLFKSTGG